MIMQKTHKISKLLRIFLGGLTVFAVVANVKCIGYVHSSNKSS